jgi:energy-coupling factor transporter transmembrane protein EcfT
MTAAPSTSPVMKGGVREIVVDFSKRQMAFVELVGGILLILGIVFPANIPVQFRKQASTVLGRLLLFVILVIILVYGKWMYGVLFAVFIAVLLSTRSAKEGFTSEFSFNMVNDKKKWWVEKILNENPVAIQDDKVSTNAVQDNGETTTSSVQDSKSSR